MKIQDLRQNSGIYILEIHPKFLKPILSVGTVVNIGRVRLNAGSSEQVFDLEVTDNNLQKKIVVPVGSEVMIHESCAYSPNSDNIIALLDNQIKQSDWVIQSVDLHKECKSECEKIISQLRTGSGQQENVNIQEMIEKAVGAKLNSAMAPILEQLKLLSPSPNPDKSTNKNDPK